MTSPPFFPGFRALDIEAGGVRFAGVLGGAGELIDRAGGVGLKQTLHALLKRITKGQEPQAFFAALCTADKPCLSVCNRSWRRGSIAYRCLVCEVDPSCAEAYNSLGTLLNDVREDYDGAEEMYRKAIELDPNVGEGRIWWGLSECLEKKNDIPGAIEAIEEYIRRGDPDNDGEARLAKLREKLT